LVHSYIYYDAVEHILCKNEIEEKQEQDKNRYNEVEGRFDEEDLRKFVEKEYTGEKIYKM